jgi:hypothetical protein
MDGKTGIITLVGIGLTFAAAIFNLIYSIRNDSKTRFVNTVTSSRMKWIDSLRDKVSAYISVTVRLLNPEMVKREPDATSSLIRERDTLRQQVILHLNPEDDKDQDIKTCVNQVFALSTRGVYTDEVANLLEHLREVTGAYLKKEWEKVKDESEKGRLSKPKK